MKINRDKNGKRIKSHSYIRYADGTMDYIAESTGKYGLFTGNSLMQSHDGIFNCEVVTDPAEIEKFRESRRVKEPWER